MWNLKFAKMFDNNIFTKYGFKPIAEDYYKIENNIFCIADGVTRDDINGNAVPYPKNKKEVEKWIELYPNPSGAYEAAKITADTFVELLKKEEKVNKEAILKVAREANSAVWNINKGRKIDYLKEDLYCCEAVGGIVQDDKLYAFSIGDCHISAYDEEFNLLFTSINNHKYFEDFLYNIYMKQNEYDWNKPECRKMVRRDYRNKPDKKLEGKDISFGAFTGEKEAEYYIDLYEVDLKNTKYICAYSDGYEPYFETKEKVQKLINAPQSSAMEGKERTLIIYEKI